MKKYNQIELIINVFETEDIVRTSNPDGDNTLPWIDVTTSEKPFGGNTLSN